MPRTPLASVLQSMAAEAHLTRRQFVGAAGAATLAAATWTPRALAATPSKVVIVGAGLAGLTCAYRLKNAGVNAALYEASDRTGGRCWSIRGVFADGQVAEHGGELIDTGHTSIRQLAKELRLPLDNLLQGEAAEDFNAVYQKLHKDVSAASYPTTYRISTERGRQLDDMSIIDWIEESVPGGLSSRFGRLLDVAYNIEYGGESSEQSALNLLYLLGYVGQGQLRLFGQSNEKFHVRGGNDQIPAALTNALKSQISLGSALVAIRQTSAG